MPFGTISIPQKAIDLAVEAMKTRRVSSGRLVREFERRFADQMGVNHAVAVCTGTDADTLALAVLHDYGAKRGDEVIVPALSFVATGNAVVHAGFTPVFVDIRKNTLNINPDEIEKAVTDRTVAIMPVHLMGKPAEMDAIMQIAARHNLPVIEDAAEAHGGQLNGNNLGTIGVMGAFSTYVAHIITTIEGGVITTNNADYAEILRSLRSHGRACKCEVCVVNIDGAYCKKRFADAALGDRRFVFERIGYSSKMNELEAAVGLANMDNFDEILGRRRRNLLGLIQGITGMSPYFFTISEDANERIGPHALPIMVEDEAPFTRDQLGDFLERNEIDYRTLFQSMPTQCPGFAWLGHREGDYPVAEFMGRNGLHIGVHHDMGDDEVDYVLEKLQEFLKKYS